MASNSLIKNAYEYTRERIMSGDIMPGDLLSENELAEKLGMSRTPVRMAISQLESEGYVTSLKNRGVLVKELSMKEVLDLYEVMYSYQRFSVDLMEERGELPDLAKLRVHLETQLRATDRGEYGVYVEHSLLFSRCLLTVTNNSTMLRTMDAFVDKIRLYAVVNYKITPHEPHYSANKVNRELYDALASRDFELMRDIMKRTYHHNRERLLRIGRI